MRTFRAKGTQNTSVPLYQNKTPTGTDKSPTHHIRMDFEVTQVNWTNKSGVIYVKGKPRCLIMSTFVVRSLFTASMVMLKFFAELLKTKDIVAGLDITSAVWWLYSVLHKVLV